MKRAILYTPVLLILGALAAPTLHSQNPASPGKGQGQQLRKRDGSCAKSDQRRGQGIRKQDGTGPRGGTAACPKTPKAPAK